MRPSTSALRLMVRLAKVTEAGMSGGEQAAAYRRCHPAQKTSLGPGKGRLPGLTHNTVATSPNPIASGHIRTYDPGPEPYTLRRSELAPLPKKECVGWRRPSNSPPTTSDCPTGLTRYPTRIGRWKAIPGSSRPGGSSTSSSRATRAVSASPTSAAWRGASPPSSRMGFEAVGIEVRDSNIAACRYVQENTDLPNLELHPGRRLERRSIWPIRRHLLLRPVLPHRPAEEVPRGPLPGRLQGADPADPLLDRGTPTRPTVCRNCASMKGCEAVGTPNTTIRRNSRSGTI